MEEYIEVKPLFYDKEKLIKQPEIIFRSNIGQKRYYYSIDDQGKLKRSPSVTTVISNEMPMSEWLVKWIARWGYERAMEKRDQAGDYGTFFGICGSQYLIDKRFDLATLKPRLDVFKQTQKIDYSTDYWIYRAKEDLYALHCFAVDYDIKPIAIEIMLFSKLGFAGAIDIVVEMTIGTGQNGRILKTDRKYDKKSGQLIEDKTRRIIAIIDWKTGRHGFFQQNEAQLHFYKILWAENYPHVPVDAIFNWSPKEWSEADTQYNLKEQSNSLESYRIMNYLRNYQISDKSAERTFKRIEGVLELGKMNGNLKYESFNERVKRIHKIYPEPKEVLTAAPPEQIYETTTVEKPKNTLVDEVNNIFSQPTEEINHE